MRNPNCWPEWTITSPRCNFWDINSTFYIDLHLSMMTQNMAFAWFTLMQSTVTQLFSLVKHCPRIWDATRNKCCQHLSWITRNRMISPAPHICPSISRWTIPKMSMALGRRLVKTNGNQWKFQTLLSVLLQNISCTKQHIISYCPSLFQNFPHWHHVKLINLRAKFH